MRATWFAVPRLVLIAAVAVVWTGSASLFRLSTASVAASPLAHRAYDPDSCCVTGDCCCPPAGLCCDPLARAKATAKPRAAKKAHDCCATGDCCCPGAGSCCAPAAKQARTGGPAPREKPACCVK